MKPSHIIAAARACVGTPFGHQGRIPQKSLDCAGLIVVVGKALGLETVGAPDGYGRAPSGGLLEQTLDLQPTIMRVYREPRAGDLILMRFKKQPQHLAIHAGATIIHAWETVGKVAEHDFTDEWKARVVRVYEFVGVENE